MNFETLLASLSQNRGRSSLVRTFSIPLFYHFDGLCPRNAGDEIGMKEKIKYEVERIKRFNQSVLNTKQQIQIKDVDIRDYAKFILKDGLIEEKRELLTCFKSKIILKNKEVFIQ